jgi:hypothetical protein
VETSGLTFSPTQLVIEVGDTVVWRNSGGGVHNVNGSTATYPSNPQGFTNGAPSGTNWEFRHVFTLPGTYTYQCDVHATLNMIGFVTVNAPSMGGGNLVISEIMYNPPESGTDIYEYIELYNNGTNAVNLLGYSFTSGVEYTFENGYNLGAGEYVIFAVDAAAFEAAFGIPAIQWTSGGLSNNGELIAFSDPDGNVVDEVNFDDSFPWPTAEADGGGASLVLCDFDADNNDGANWQAASTGTGVISEAIEIFANPGAASQCVDGATVRFLTTSVEVSETIGTVTLQVEIRDAGAGTFTVNVGYDAASTATLGADGSYAPTSLTFNTGAAVDTLDVTITIVNDAAAEVLESFILRLENPSNNLAINGVGSSSTVLIADDDTFIPSVVITEIMYNPPGTDTQYEYLELYNNDDVAVNLEGYAFTQGIVHTFPAVTLQPGEYLAVAVDSVSLFAAFGVEALQWTSGALNNGGETLELRDAQGNVVDVVAYSNQAPWATTANGNGPALVLCDPSADNNDSANWIAAVQPTGVFLNGTAVLGSPGAFNDCTPPAPQGYTSYPIGQVTGVNADGVADSLGVRVQLTGVVYGVNLRPNGLQFTLIDGSNDGIGAFSNANNFGYTVAEGDAVTILGTVGQFNGLTQVNLDTVILNSAGNTLFNPTAITALGEADESQLVQLTNVTITDVQVAGGLNVTVTDGVGNTNLVRINFNTNINEAFITGLGGATLSITGIGGQFDSSSPFTEGYQLTPRYQADIDVVSSTGEPAWAAGVRVFPNPAQERLYLATDTELTQVRIVNALGQVVMQTQGATTELSVQHLPAGTYLLEMWQHSERVVRRWVKQ